MRVRIIKWNNVIEHCETDKKMLKAFHRFHEVVKNAHWSNPQDIIRSFNDSELVKCKKHKTTRIIFNIGQNKYRLIVGYYFAPNQTILYVKFAGTHKEYDLINACTIDMFKKKEK